MPIEAILFDCDGTLVDSERLANEVLVQYAQEFGIILSVDEAVKLFTGISMTETITNIERRATTPLPKTFLSELRTRTAAAFTQRLKPMDGAHSLLQQLTLPYCVASSGPREKIELSLTLTGLLNFFGTNIYSSYEIGSWKPEPDLFLHAAAQLGVPPAQCAVVEDSNPGIEAGLSAGMTVFAYQRDDLQHDPRICVLPELTALLEVCT